MIARRCAQDGHDAEPGDRHCRVCAEEMPTVSRPRNELLSTIHPEVGLVCIGAATGCEAPFPHWHLNGVRKEGFPGEIELPEPSEPQ